MVDITIVDVVYKPTYNWGAPSCGYTRLPGLFDVEAENKQKRFTKFSSATGYCLEKGFLSRWFPWETWGRRAPWYLTHCIGCAICTSLLHPGY